MWRFVGRSGLVAPLFGDRGRGLRVAWRLRTGSIAINGACLPFPLVPFGGFKESGLGRELGPEGLAGFAEPRSIELPASLGSGWRGPEPPAIAVP